ncbi:Os05g0569400 [Oryza sativa Japonica Group]|uniref:Os05g0569400 protein n=1 Tax=Oryza sativa subsp. japonica TaxID=39947 RepID=A0A0P0WQ23_ORYSJ|nr:hypothetical protein EE612_031228 [Oryza sativa]BAS95407.1 Os05g0569400 [Oryza sativa Japonica Group]
MSMGHYTNLTDPRTELEVVRDWNGVDQVVLRSPRGAYARVSLHGGQVLSWRNDRGEELLFTSSKVTFFFFQFIFRFFSALQPGSHYCD